MNCPQPTLETPRLILRPFAPSDAASVAKYAGDYDIYRNTLRIPYPYQEEQAAEWIAAIQPSYEQGKAVIFAIVPRDLDHITGAVGLELGTAAFDSHTAELGFWTGKPFWGKGYCTEATTCVLGYGFSRLGLSCIWAAHFCSNVASSKVMQKLGMKHEGKLRQRYMKDGECTDVESWSILRGEYPGDWRDFQCYVTDIQWTFSDRLASGQRAYNHYKLFDQVDSHCQCEGSTSSDFQRDQQGQ